MIVTNSGHFDLLSFEAQKMAVLNLFNVACHKIMINTFILKRISALVMQISYDLHIFGCRQLSKSLFNLSPNFQIKPKFRCLFNTDLKASRIQSLLKLNSYAENFLQHFN